MSDDDETTKDESPAETADRPTGVLFYLADLAESELPIDQIDPRLRLGTMIRRARVRAKKGLREVSEILDISLIHLGQVERGLVTMGTAHLEQIASLTGCDYLSLVNASRDFQLSLWGPKGSLGGEMSGNARVVYQMTAAQLFVEYREGWCAGASGRANPSDMSPTWESGHADGRTAMEDALQRHRLGLDAAPDGASSR